MRYFEQSKAVKFDQNWFLINFVTKFECFWLFKNTNICSIFVQKHFWTIPSAFEQTKVLKFVQKHLRFVQKCFWTNCISFEQILLVLIALNLCSIILLKKTEKVYFKKKKDFLNFFWHFFKNDFFKNWNYLYKMSLLKNASIPIIMFWVLLKHWKVFLLGTEV